MRTTTRSGTTALPADPADYWRLMKPRVMSLVVFTAFVGMATAPVALHPVIAAAALLAIAVGAGASGALNMWYDADIDAIMARTRNRPVPAGRLHPDQALGFGLFLSAASVAFLGLFTNWLAAALLAFTIFFYLVIYTMWLKRRTPQNIVIGGAAGALPPVVAWAAATGRIDLEPLILFAIIFAWTPPHFWALSLWAKLDYQRAGVPMLPVTAGVASTRRHILVYSLLLAPIGAAPAMIGMAGALYAVVAVIAGGWFIWLALATWRERPRSAQRLFRFSLTYLFAIFAALLLEKAVL